MAPAQRPDAAVHPVMELVRALPLILGRARRRQPAAAAAAGAAWSRVGVADRGRPAALGHHHLPGHPGPGRGAARTVQQERADRAPGPGPQRRPDLPLHAPAARPDPGRHRHRPDRPAAGTAVSSSTDCPQRTVLRLRRPNCSSVPAPPADVGTVDRPGRRADASRCWPSSTRAGSGTGRSRLSGLVTIGVVAAFAWRTINEARLDPDRIGVLHDATAQLAGLPIAAGRARGRR